MKGPLILTAFIALAGSALGEDAMQDILVKPDELAWKDAPNLPKGGQVAILVGDPTKPGEVVVQRLKFPPNYHVPPHTHPYAEFGTVISGSFGVGMGEKLEKKGETFDIIYADPPYHIITIYEELLSYLDSSTLLTKGGTP